MVLDFSKFQFEYPFAKTNSISMENNAYGKTLELYIYLNIECSLFLI